jgi:hypothetical protein
MTDDEWQHLVENFETTELLTAVDAVDRVRDDFNDRDDAGPPQIREDLFNLHQLATAVVNHGSRRQAPELFHLAGALQDQVEACLEHLEQVREVLARLTALCPVSLVDAQLLQFKENDDAG